MASIQVIAQVINGMGTFTNMIAISFKDKRKIMISFMLGNLLVAIALGLLNATMGMIVELVFVIEAIINYFFEKKYNKYPNGLLHYM